MKSVNQRIANIINKHISIQKCLKRDLINQRALARFLINEYSLSYGIDAVISAIRRYDLDEVSLNASKDAKEAFKNMSITIKDSITKITVKDKAFSQICKDYNTKRLLKKNARMIKAKESITLLVNQNNVEEKINVFTKDQIINVRKDLAEIRVEFRSKIETTRGIIAELSGELALHDINIEEIIVSLPEFFLYVKESDSIKAHQSLLGMK
tara:strand:+ start:153 stop:785 length:633 start_codon:yes stop_codon:yes gene_type:complete